MNRGHNGGGCWWVPAQGGPASCPGPPRGSFSTGMGPPQVRACASFERQSNEHAYLRRVKPAISVFLAAQIPQIAASAA
jgi:hypothetical protein